MSLTKVIITIAVIVAVILGITYLFNLNKPLETEDNGNNQSQIIETKIDQEVSFLGVKIVPLEVLEDSRCPSDVTCIQAGTVRLRTLLTSASGEAEQVFELRQPVTTEAEEITLVEVNPEMLANIPIQPGEYTFIFEIKKR